VLKKIKYKTVSLCIWIQTFLGCGASACWWKNPFA